MIVGQGAATVGAQQHRRRQPLDQGAQFRRRAAVTFRPAAAQHAAAGDEQRPLGAGQQLGCARDRRRRRLQGGGPRSGRGRQVVLGQRGGLQVDRNLDAARLRAAGQEVVDHERQRRSYALPQPHCLHAPGDGAQHRRLLLRLVQKAASLAQVGGVDLAGDHQYRR